VIIGNEEMCIIDLKYGKGVAVDAEDNPQLKLYALGALEMFDDLYDINSVSMTIFQPRRENISTITVFKESLYQWAEEILKPNAERAVKGEGEFVAGEHCQFCRANNECRARATANMELAKYDFIDPPLLEDNEIADVLGKVDDLTRWAKSVKEFALREALKGRKWDGWKLVTGKSNREYTDAAGVADRLLKAGFRDIYQPPKLLGITEMTKVVGKKLFGEILEGGVKNADGEPTYSSLVHKPKGKPTLVPLDDKRQEIDVNTAFDDFAEALDNNENMEE
jgi:hypothetical protein